jgi:hypothetical protein
MGRNSGGEFELKNSGKGEMRGREEEKKSEETFLTGLTGFSG